MVRLATLGFLGVASDRHSKSIHSSPLQMISILACLHRRLDDNVKQDDAPSTIVKSLLVQLCTDPTRSYFRFTMDLAQSIRSFPVTAVKLSLTTYVKHPHLIIHIRLVLDIISIS